LGANHLDFLTQAPVSGPLLAERLASGPLSAEEALRYTIELGTAIGRAHSQGMVHGAISPRSIAITANGVHLLDPPQSAAEAYCSPEQVRGSAPDARSDIFSFGAVAYEMACGQPPFAGTGAELKRAILGAMPAPLAASSPAEAALDDVIAGCLEKDPTRRRQRIQNAVTELRLATRLPSRTEGALTRKMARPAPPPQPVPEWTPPITARNPAPVELPAPPIQDVTCDCAMRR